MRLTHTKSVGLSSNALRAIAGSARACTRKAKEQVIHSLVYSYRDRRQRKGDFRRLWIQRINAGSRANGLTYNRFIQGLGLAGIEVDRRMLAELAVHEPSAFATLVEEAKKALPKDTSAPQSSPRSKKHPQRKALGVFFA